MIGWFNEVHTMTLFFSKFYKSPKHLFLELDNEVIIFSKHFLTSEGKILRVPTQNLTESALKT